MPKSQIQKLHDAGFDKSYYKQETCTWRVGCSQCEACVINGLPCHETGCPNQPDSAPTNHSVKHRRNNASNR